MGEGNSPKMAERRFWLNATFHLIIAQLSILWGKARGGGSPSERAPARRPGTPAVVSQARKSAGRRGGEGGGGEWNVELKRREGESERGRGTGSCSAARVVGSGAATHCYSVAFLGSCLDWTLGSAQKSKLTTRTCPQRQQKWTKVIVTVT